MTTYNPRGAGRKRALSDEQIKKLRERHNSGETISSLAKEAGVSRQTLSAYIGNTEPGIVSDFGRCFYTNYKRWVRFNRMFRDISSHEYTLRMDFMNNDMLCTAILVDFTSERIKIYNNTDDIVLRAFGVKVSPSWQDFENFLDERCIPKTRFNMKEILRDIGLDQYDRIRILEKTEGRTGEDSQWIRFTYYRAS